MAYKEEKASIFVTSSLFPITFYVEECRKHCQAVKLICDGGGEVIEDLTEIDSFTVILVEKEDFRPIYDRVVFIPDYVIDCYERSSLLHMNAYCHEESSENFLNIIFYQSKIFPIVGFRIPQLSQFDSPIKRDTEPYTLEEDTAIVLYIIRKKALHKLASKDLWITLQYRNVVRGRTWQSLRVHFFMNIATNLSQYPFLTAAEKNIIADHF